MGVKKFSAACIDLILSSYENLELFGILYFYYAHHLLYKQERIANFKRRHAHRKLFFVSRFNSPLMPFGDSLWRENCDVQVIWLKTNLLLEQYFV